jgi:hypothetical protein
MKSFVDWERQFLADAVESAVLVGKMLNNRA